MKKLRQTYGFEKPIDDAYPLPIIPSPPRNPTVNDTEYVQGQIWINISTNEIWLLSSFSGGNAIWILIGNSLFDLDTLTGDIGGAVNPDALNNINLLGSNGISTTGNPGTNTITFSQIGAFVQQHIFYVGKHGNDANAGTNINTAVLTFTQALILATAAAPSAVNRYAIVCLDDGIYAENITSLQYVDIYAPNATLTGSIIAVDNSSVKFKTLNVADGVIGVLKAVGAAYSDIDIDEVNVAGTGIGFISLSGLMNCIWKRMFIVNGFGVGDGSSALAHMHLKGGDIYISGAGIGIARANTGSTVGRVDHIVQLGAAAGAAVLCIDGSIDINISRIDGLLNGIVVTGGACNLVINTLSATTAYNVANGATLKLVCDTLLGTEIYGATATLGIRYANSTNNGQIVLTSSDVVHTRTRVGQEVRFQAQNPDNTNANSYAHIECSVGGPAAGDPSISVNVPTGSAWAFGIDNSVADNLFIGASPSTPSLANPAVTITSGTGVGAYGNTTFPKTCAFLAYLASDVANATGDGTQFTIPIDTVLFDQNSNFNVGTYTFTAPVDGKYCLSAGVYLANIGAAHTAGLFKIITTSRTFVVRNNAFNCAENTGELNYYQTVFVDMAAGDTATIAIAINNGAKTVTVKQGTAAVPNTFFSGFLQC